MQLPRMCVTTGRLAIMASEVAGATVREAGTRPWSLPPPRTLRSLALYLAVIAVGAAVLGWVGASLAAPVTSYQALLHEVLPSDGNAPPSAETTVSANAHGLALSSAVAVSDEVQVEVYAKGAGSGRETAIRSLQAAGLEVTTVKDVSPQAHNGCRPRKRRRV